MRIDNVTIHVNVQAAERPQLPEFLLKLRKGTEAGAAPATTLKPPPIGEVWPGQGGIYAGIVRGVDGAADAHMVLSEEKPTAELTWQAAIDWAKSGAPAPHGHDDFALPTRFQSAVLYGNLREQFENSGWYWTSSESSERSAWIQHFDNGTQRHDGKSYEARARAVRLIPLTA